MAAEPPLIITRKAIKHAYARERNGVLHISVPLKLSDAQVASVVEDLRRKLQRRQLAANANAAETLLPRAQALASRFPQPITLSSIMFVTTQRARWASYSTQTGVIRVHALLQRMPAWVLEAVIAHELAHVIHPNHSPAFWSLLHEVCPTTEQARAFLNGVTWLAHTWDTLSPDEQALLRRDEED